MSLINATLMVATLYECDHLQDYVGKIINTYEPSWIQTVTGCHIVDILRDMYKFNVSYVDDVFQGNDTISVVSEANVTYTRDVNFDVYIRSMSLTRELLDYIYPVISTHTWRFGFLLRLRSANHFFCTFYSKPFTRIVWNCLYAMALFISIIFYLFKRLEYRLLGGADCSFPYEWLMVIGAYCQHIPPIDPQLASRRIAYLIFFVFAYIVYTYYTSNLLSNLVNERNHGIDLETLAQTDNEFFIVDYMMLAFAANVRRYNLNDSLIMSKLMELKPLSVPAGLEAVKKGHVALLSDYITIIPYIKKHFDNEDICQLISVDVFSDIKKYLFTSKDFQYREQFKIGTLRIKETGILNYLMTSDRDVLQCTPINHVEANLMQISIPLTILAGAYVVSALILVAERIHYKNNKVLPYVE